MLDGNKIVVPVQTVEVSGYVISSFIKTAGNVTLISSYYFIILPCYLFINVLG